MSSWLLDNKLLVNPKKCEVMFIGTQQRLNNTNNLLDACSVYIDGDEIKRVEFCKYLGVIIDQNLSWNRHVDYVKKKVTKCVYLLKRLRPYINQDTALLFFKSVIQSNFDYCSVVWGKWL